MVKSNMYRNCVRNLNLILQVCSDAKLTMVKSNNSRKCVKNLDLILQVCSDAKLTMVKSNNSRKCVKNMDLTTFKFVQFPPMTRTSLEEAKLEFGD